MDANFVKPLYDAGGFAGLPRRILKMASSGDHDAVVVFLIDGFGWRFFEKYQHAPFLRQVTRDGRVSRLTSQFPSTTAAHVTTIHSGLPVGEHGVYEWYYYEPALDAVIAPLLFSFAGAFQRETLKSTRISPARLYPEATFYRQLKKHGVDATVFQSRDYTPSTYSNAVMAGARMVGFRTLAEGLVNLGEALANSAAPAYYLFYFDKIDAVCHEYGPGAPQLEAEILSFLLAMENIFLTAQAASKKRIQFLLTADHGLSETDPQTTIYLNRDPDFAGVARFLQTNRRGERIVPAGSARDFFLHIEPNALEEARAFLSSRLEGRAEVRTVVELAGAGYFGPVISPAFQGRVGNLVILPYRGESVWWYEKDRFEQRFRGHHGGLTKEEMEIPLVTWEMG